MARRKKKLNAVHKKVEDFRHVEAQRRNNPPAGMASTYEVRERQIRIILEVKGFETEQDRQKEAAARRWVKAVNHHGEFGRWAFAVCREPMRLRELLTDVVREQCAKS
jgi:hypothetical protein